MEVAFSDGRKLLAKVSHGNTSEVARRDSSDGEGVGKRGKEKPLLSRVGLVCAGCFTPSLGEVGVGDPIAELVPNFSSQEDEMSSKKTVFVIEGALVTKRVIEEGTNFDGSRWVRETTHGTVRLEDWLEKLWAARGDQTFTPQLQGGHLLARKSRGEKECVVVEFRPAVRRIIEKVDQSDERARLLAFPWVYLVIRFRSGAVDKMYVFYRNSRAEDPSVELYLPNLPNVYGRDRGYKICTGSVSGLDPAWPLACRLDWLVRSFWDSQFNRDLLSEHWSPSTRLAGHPRSFAEWGRKSQEDPSFILKIPWRPLGKTIQDLLEEGVR